MKIRTSNTETIDYAGTLHLDDIKEIMNILLTICENVTLSTDHYEDVGIDDLNDLFEKTQGQIKRMQIEACNQMWPSVDFVISPGSVGDEASVSIYIGSDKIPYSLKAKIQEILKRGEKKHYYFWRKSICLFWLILWIMVCLAVPVYFQRQTPDDDIPFFIIYIIAIVVGFMMWIYYKIIQAFFPPLAFLKTRQQSFWKRNKDRILISLMLLIMTVVFTWLIN